MYLTEDEAKTKWCPFSRVLFRNSSTANRIDPWYKTIVDSKERKFLTDQENNCKCIASDCMAWRFEEGDSRLVGFSKEYPHQKFLEYIGFLPDIEEIYQSNVNADGLIEWRARLKTTLSKGRCGLANK